jgi:hypothetical protein
MHRLQPHFQDGFRPAAGLINLIFLSPSSVAAMLLEGFAWDKVDWRLGAGS